MFREANVSSGIFELGASDLFNQMPSPETWAANQDDIEAVFLMWQARVRDHYYR